MASTINNRMFWFAFVAATMTFAGAVQAKTCSEEMPEIKSMIEAIPDSADKNTAAHQYGKAQERLSAGKEKSCLRYLESARAAIEAYQMHDDD